MNIKFSFVPPGGGEQDYSLEFELPAIPQAGDYIYLTNNKDGKIEHGSFIVRRTWWHLNYTNEGGHLKQLWCEAEFAESPYDSEPHQQSIKMYANRGKSAKSIDNSAY